MKCKGLTRVEVIVVIISITILIGTLLLLPSVFKGGPFQMSCARNLAVLGKVMQLYCNDYNGNYPHAGGPNTIWARYTKDWDANNRSDAYALDSNGTSGQASISSCLYLLVKHYQVKPELFICGGDSGVRVFKPAEYGISKKDLTKLWDFGQEPELRVSYSYHTPFNEYALTTASDPGMAILADRNPWITSEAAEHRRYNSFNPYGDRENIKKGNSLSHQEEGQNVLFVDGHVGFEDVSFCGVNKDNIYTYWSVDTYWNRVDILKGILPSPCCTYTKPQDKMDSLLVHDGEGQVLLKIRGVTPDYDW